MDISKQSVSAIKFLLASESLGANLLNVLEKDNRKAVQDLVRSYHGRLERQEKLKLRAEELRIHEKKLWKQKIIHIAGVDEAGAGPLAGPVVAAAVILPQEVWLPGVDDSKKLSAAKRGVLKEEIQKAALSYAIGFCSPEEIDEINILEASRLAMLRAVEGLKLQPEYLLVDARHIPRTKIKQESLIEGDARSVSIAAASILAKEYRDALMTKYAEVFPGYGFEQHVGYGTQKHLEALKKLGPCPIHRKSFAPVRRYS